MHRDWRLRATRVAAALRIAWTSAAQFNLNLSHNARRAVFHHRGHAPHPAAPAPRGPSDRSDLSTPPNLPGAAAGAAGEAASTARDSQRSKLVLVLFEPGGLLTGSGEEEPEFHRGEGVGLLDGEEDFGFGGAGDLDPHR